MNSITLSGNVGNDPESRTIPSGETVVTVSIADSYGSKDNRKVQWFRCEFWGKSGEVISKYVKKGSKLTVVGDFKAEVYTNKDGVEKTTLKVNVRSFDFGSSSDSSGDNQQTSSYPVATNQAAAIPAGAVEEDLPF